MNNSNQNLEQIVPEYNSKILLVKKLFFDRIKYAIELAEIEDGLKVLDLGCGNGSLLKEIRKVNRNCELEGIDINNNVVNLKIENCCVRVQDITKQQLKNTYDVIFALDVLEHIEDASRILRELKENLNNAGKLIVSGPTENWFYKLSRFVLKGTFSEKTGPGAGKHHYDIEEIDKIILENGFTIKNRVKLPKYSPMKLFIVTEYRL